MRWSMGGKRIAFRNPTQHTVVIRSWKKEKNATADSTILNAKKLAVTPDKATK